MKQLELKLTMDEEEATKLLEIFTNIQTILERMDQILTPMEKEAKQ